MEQIESLSELFHEIGFRLTKIASSGELAQLKRQKSDEAPVPAFYHIVMPSLEKYKFYPKGDEEKAIEFERNLTAILTGMANDTTILNLANPLGSALGKAGFPDLRFYRFLKASGATLRKQIVYMCRYLSSKGNPGNLGEAFELMRNQGSSDAAVRIRRKISRDYYRTLSQSNSIEEK